MVMSEAWPDISYEGDTHQFQPENNSLKAAEAVSLNISSHETSLKWSQRMFQSAQE